MKKPTVTIYQNEDNLIVVFSPVNNDGVREYRGASVSFENNWNDGGACGTSFSNKKELDKHLKKFNYKKRGTLELSNDYCRENHTVKSIKGRPHGGTATCMLPLKHKSKHQGFVGAVDFGKGSILVKW
jgi:hypothetical protein